MIDPTKIKKVSSSNEVTENFFFTIMIAGASMAHSKHLMTTGPSSYAHHMALDEFYKAFRKPVDSVIETYQGAANKIVQYDKDAFSFGFDMEPLIYLTTLRSIITDNAYNIIPEKYCAVHNELDNVVTQLNSTIYKLTFLS